MDTVAFLSTVWPAQGTYLTAIPISWTDSAGKPQSGFRHFAHTSVEAAAKHALAAAYDRESPTDVYFALGTVKEDLTRLTAEQRKALGKKVRGKHKSGHDNTAALRAFWLDLDVKADPAAYATQHDAAEALRGFCRAMGLPRPLVTSSGGGLHVYWPLTHELETSRWEHYAGILKRLTKSWGLRADPSRTADAASVLRPVGSFNFKNPENPREVRVVMTGGVNDTEQFLLRLATLAETNQLQAPVAARKPQITVAPSLPALLGERPDAAGDAAINTAAQTGVSMAAAYTDANPKAVVAKCQQLRWQASHQQEVNEPQWYAMIGCLRHAMNGPQAVHAMSRGHVDYTAEATDAKIQQHVDGGFGPTLCETFEIHRPGGCAGCPHLGKIKTPLVLGRQLKEVAPPVATLQMAGETIELPLPNPPAPFKRAINVHTGQARITVTLSDEDGDYEEEVYEYDIYPSGLVLDERDNKFHVVVNRWLPQDGWDEFTVPTGSLYDRRKLATTLGDMGVMPDLGKVEQLVQYMIGYIRELQKRSRAAIVYAQLGWRNEIQFVLPDMVVTPSGAESVTPSAHIVNAFQLDTRGIRAGDLDTWKNIVSIFERPQMVAHQFGFGVGFAAPLLTLTQYSGMIVSLVGEAGAGKSSALLCANSIFGHPWMGEADLKHDTVRAVYAKLGAANNIVTTFDENTNVTPEELSDLAYAINKGQGRQGLKQDGTMRENRGGWTTMLLTTANASIHERLAAAKANASAESVRVFEYRVPEHTLTKQEADDNFKRLLDNFGTAGPIYAAALVKNRPWAKDRVAHWVGIVDRAAGVTSGERFWSACVACVLTGFELANSVGLTNANIPALLEFAVGAIGSMRSVVNSNIRDPLGLVAEYVTVNLRNTLVLNTDPSGGNVPLLGMEPSGELRIRVEAYSHRMYIDRPDFRRFCTSRGMDAKTVEVELRRIGVLRATDTRLVLGRGTKYGLVQNTAWLFDLNHPAMGNVPVAAVPSPAQAATP